MACTLLLAEPHLMVTFTPFPSLSRKSPQSPPGHVPLCQGAVSLFDERKIKKENFPFAERSNSALLTKLNQRGLQLK